MTKLVKIVQTAENILNGLKLYSGLPKVYLLLTIYRPCIRVEAAVHSR